MLGRYASEIRTGCANERPSGSVRGHQATGVPTAIASNRHHRAGLRESIYSFP